MVAPTSGSRASSAAPSRSQISSSGKTWAAAVLLWVLLWRTWRWSGAAVVRLPWRPVAHLAPKFVRQMLAISLLLPAVAFAADVAENVLIEIGVWPQMGQGGPSEVAAWVVTGLTIAKWLSVILVAVALGIAWLTLSRLAAARTALRLGWRRIKDGAADGCTNLHVMLSAAQANDKLVHVDVDASNLITTGYLV